MLVAKALLREMDADCKKKQLGHYDTALLPFSRRVNMMKIGRVNTFLNERRCSSFYMDADFPVTAMALALA